MSEAFIYYVWQYQYFERKSLQTTEGEGIHIFSPGTRNVDSGPDFLNAKIRVGEMQWVGSVEIHINSSEWRQHQHHLDEAYDNVILHVVWKSNGEILRKDGTSIPTLELAARVDENLLFRYRRLINSVDEIPCSYALPQLKPLVLLNTLDRTAAGRLETKAREVLSLLERNRGDWSETAYQLLARNFGFKVNTDPFLQLAQALPLKILQKHADQRLQIEAMLFGVAGFLDDHCEDSYYLLLQREFNVLRQKYKLDYRMMKKVQWKFLRLRPANFPTLRIAQFAACVAVEPNLFSVFINADTEGLKKVIGAETSSYWKHHYKFSGKAVEKDNAIGSSSVQMLIINTVVPLLAAFSIFRDDQHYMERAVLLLHELPPEQNLITRRWDQFTIKSKNAFDSQALIGLYNNFCSRHRCLDCNIGASLIKPNKT